MFSENLIHSVWLFYEMRITEDEAWSGRPSEAVCAENCRAVEDVILRNGQISVHQIADTGSYDYPKATKDTTSLTGR